MSSELVIRTRKGLGLTVFLWFVLKICAFELHLYSKDNRPGYMLFNSSLDSGRRYFIESSSIPSSFMQIDPENGELYIKRTLSLHNKSLSEPLHFSIGSESKSEKSPLVEYVIIPISVHLKSNSESNYYNRNDFVEAVVNVEQDMENNFDTCWKKSQEILSMSSIIPQSQLKRCDVIYVQPSEEGYCIETNGGQLVVDRNLCNSALTWTLEFSIKVECSDISYVQPLRMHFQRTSSKRSYRDRLRRSTQNHAPTFDLSLYKATVPEEVEGGYAVTTVTAKDPDGDNITYRLVAAIDSRSNRLFEIDEDLGHVTTTTHLDREFLDVHYLRIVAYDNQLPSLSGTTTLLVEITDRNDHSPVFEQATYVASIREMSPIGSNVITVRATDQDVGENSEIEYNLIHPSGGKVFQIDKNSGVISLSVKLDREETAFYSLLVQATDMGKDPEPRSTTAVLEISILDDNDNYPQFLKKIYYIDVPEDIEWTVRPVIAVVKAEDKDQGVNAAIRYAIIGGNTQGHFNIDSQSGELTVVSALDYETARSYRLIIRAQDGGQPARSNTTNMILRVLDANDNDPKFYTSLFQESVSEGAPIGHSVLRVQAYDADDGPNSEIIYSIVPSEQLLPFTVDSMSGWILTTRELDRETNAVYDFQLVAKDRGSPSRSSTTSVIIRVQDINDNDPVFDPKVYEASVSEIDPPGTPVVAVTAADKDEEPRLIYHIVSGNHRGRFNVIHQNREGLISVAQPLDFRLDKIFTLTVTATDAGGRFDTAIVNINVTDANTHRPVFDKVPYTASVPEDAPIGTTVLVVEAVDGDVGENARVSYFIEDNPEFSIDSTTGAIITSQKLDRELTAGFILVVTAEDHGSPSLSDTINVEIEVTDVNDNPPNFVLPSYAASIREDALVGSSVLQVSASDKDIGLSGQVRYTFTGGDDGDGAFLVEPTSGVIRTNQLLDRESVSLYRLTVLAIDRGATPLSSAATISVLVEDINDNPPRFDTDIIKMFISENSPIGSLVGLIFATDPDDGPNAEISYSIVGGPDADKFRLISRNGEPAELLTKTDLDYETSKKKFIIIVRASSPPLRSDVEVHIWVTDVNDNAPRLNNFVIFFNHHENHFPKNPVGKVPAYDADVTDKLRYRFVSGNNANLLLLDEKTGELSLSPHLDTNVPIHGVMEISVYDGINEVTAECQLFVQLVTDSMLFNSATLRIRGMTAAAFLSPVLEDFIDGLAAIIPCPRENLYIFSIQEDNYSEERILNVSFSARPSDARDSTTFFSSQYLQERVYLGRALLAKLTHVHVLPFEDNLCVREPCINFEQCLSVLKFGNASDFVASDTYFFRAIIPVNTFACRCPPGFTGMNHKYECDTEVNLCYSSPCFNGGTCHRREGGYTCVCKEAFTGPRCEVNLSNSTCSLGICHGDSHCVNVSSAVQCKNCAPEAWSSKLCELRARSFSKGTYLTFPALRQRHRLSISLKFATQQRHALLLYNGRYNDENDFISLEIINGQLEFSFSLGGPISKVSTLIDGGVSDGQWHTAYIYYFNRTATLSVDDCDIGLSLKYGKSLGNYLCANSTTRLLEERCADFMETCYRYLDLTGPLQLGGLPALLSDLQIKNTGFSGCIMDFFVDHQLVDLNKFVSNSGAVVGCPQKSGFCRHVPCKNGGTCVDGWETFICICPQGFVSKDCSETVDPGKHFMGDGFIVFIPHLHPIQLPWTQRVSFRTHHDHGLLLQIKLGHNSLIVIEIVDGYIRYVFNNQQLLLPDVLVNDGKWHNVEATWFPNWLHLSLDYGQHEVKKVMKASIRGMYIGKVSVGGVESSDDDGKVTFFVGCMQSVKIGSSQGSWLRPMVEVNVREGCFSPDQCSSNPCPVHSTCVEHWGNFSCKCDNGYVGKDCLPVCQLNPCSNSSTCETFPPSLPARKSGKTYTCKCDAHHTGTYCETLLDLPCPSNWWGYPICGPCQCDVNKGYSADCNKTTGECVCEEDLNGVSVRCSAFKIGTYYFQNDGQENHFQPPDSSVCYPCECYSVGSYGNDCNPITGQCNCRPGVIGRRCDSCSNPLAEVTLRGCEVVYDSCPRSYSGGIWWPRTMYEIVAEQDCPDGSFGKAYRFCNEGDGWEEPDLFGCTNPPFHKLAQQLEDIEKGVSEMNASVAVEMVTELNSAVNKTFPLYGNDIRVFKVLLDRIVDHEKQKSGFDLCHRQDRDFIKNMIQATNAVLSPIYLDHWNQITKSTGQGVEKVMEIYEDYLNILMHNFVDTFTRPFEIVEKNIVLGVDTVSIGDLWSTPIENEINNETEGLEISPYVEYTLEDGIKIPSIIFPKFNNYPIRDDFENHLAEAIIPFDVAGIKEHDGFPKMNKEHTSSKEVAVVGYIIYLTMGELLPPMFGESIRYQGIPLHVNTPVLTVLIQPMNSTESEKKLQKEVRLKFQVLNTTGTSPQCAFWNFDKDKGYWSTEGCEVQYYESGGSHINCTCNHLSSFTVLMERNHNEFIPTESTAQSVISYIAIVISLVLLAVTFIIFCLLKGSQTNSNTIHICLIASIFLAELIFLIALKTRHTLVFQQFPCKMVAILLHFLFLSIFSWLFVEAVHIFRMMTNLCDINHGPMHCYLFIGFGGPALIVGLSVGISVDQYGNHFFCWLSVHESVVWSLVGPVCVVVIVTLGVFISAFRASFRSKDAVMDFGGLKTLLWVAVMLLPIQGSTWVLAILSVNETHTILQYAFSFFCLLEGVYIFVGYCVINKKVQQQIYSMWLCVCKPKHHTDLNGQASTFLPSSKVYHRNIGISTASATSRSTARTYSSTKVESDQRLSAAHASTSEADDQNGNRETEIKHLSQVRSTKSHLDDVLNGNHIGYIRDNRSITENSIDNSTEELKLSESIESSSPGPKMGIHILSHPRLPGSRSPLNRPSLSLKTGLNSKDQSVGTPPDHPRSSPVSAPACSSRPDFSSTRMGISLVEKSIHSSRDHIIDSRSLDNRSYSSNPCIRPDFRTGICSYCRSQSSLKDALNNYGPPSLPQHQICSKSVYTSSPKSKQKTIPGHQNKQSNSSLQVLPKTEDLRKSKEQSNLKFKPEHSRALSDGSAIKSGASLNRTTSNDELKSNALTPDESKEMMETPSHSTESFHESSAPSALSPIHSKHNSNESCQDRSSPKLIDDTPSDEDVDMSFMKFEYSPTDGSINIIRILNRQKTTIPPLATAELSDSDFNAAQETLV